MSTIQEDASKNFKIADYIQFGNYPQTLQGDIKPIEWQILLIEDNKMLVISKYGLVLKQGVLMVVQMIGKKVKFANG